MPITYYGRVPGTNLLTTLWNPLGQSSEGNIFINAAQDDNTAVLAGLVGIAVVIASIQEDNLAAIGITVDTVVNISSIQDDNASIFETTGIIASDLASVMDDNFGSIVVANGITANMAAITADDVSNVGVVHTVQYVANYSWKNDDDTAVAVDVPVYALRIDSLNSFFPKVIGQGKTTTGGAVDVILTTPEDVVLFIPHTVHPLGEVGYSPPLTPTAV